MTNLKDILVDGPWTDEPDQEVFMYQGTFCLICRQTTMGFVNGYIGIAKDHPWFSVDYEEISANCHGGLTYSSESPPIMGYKNVKLGPEWWIGFDTGHLGDLTPSFRNPNYLNPNYLHLYRDWEYVRSEVKGLVAEAQNALYEIYLKENMDLLPLSFHHGGDILQIAYPGHTAQFYRFRNSGVERWCETTGWEYSKMIQTASLLELSNLYNVEMIPLDTWKNKMAMRELEQGEQL